LYDFYDTFNSNKFSLSIEGRYFLWRRKRKAIVYRYINHNFCEITDSVSSNCKNDMWTEITNPCRLRNQNC